jgi:hypothetical protein
VHPRRQAEQVFVSLARQAGRKIVGVGVEGNYGLDGNCQR